MSSTLPRAFEVANVEFPVGVGCKDSKACNYLRLLVDSRKKIRTTCIADPPYKSCLVCEQKFMGLSIGCWDRVDRLTARAFHSSLCL